MSVESLGRVVASAAVLGMLASAGAGAQAMRGSPLRAGVSAASARFERDDGRPVSGVIVGVDAQLTMHAIVLEVGYSQGSLAPDGSAGVEEDVVDGKVLVGLDATSWLRVSGGPHLRAYVTPTGTERWIRWEVRLRAETELVPGLMTVDGQLAAALASDVNVAEAGAAARSASVGVNLRLANSPFDLRLSYDTDRATFGSSGVEFLQSVGLGVSVGRR